MLLYYLIKARGLLYKTLKLKLKVFTYRKENLKKLVKI